MLESLTSDAGSTMGSSGVRSAAARGAIADALAEFLAWERASYQVHGMGPAVCVGVLVGVALTPASAALAGHWVREDPLPDNPADALVVLCGGLGTGSLLNSAGGSDRLLTGLERLQQRRGRRLLTTRVSRLDGGHLVTSDSNQRRLIDLAGVEPAWERPGTVQHTREEASRAASRLLPLGARRVVVVTSPLHSRRACAAFEAVGFQVSCAPARERGSRTRRPLSTSDCLAAFRAYPYERVAMWKYRTRGWVP